ncbi:hypothetical protein [Nocardia terpenica]|uniref:hypothetical protein n=1 Tax=Nocardia terpenica TaxID=455432 RepID=UPI0018E09395|nr:hypothetical protein [Nocardia terpenica]
MSQLLDLVQRHLDRYGVRPAEFARRIGASPQTFYSWQRREMKQLPDRRLLRGIAEVTGFPYWQVLEAALLDSGYRDAPAEVTEIGQRLRDLPIDDCREIATLATSLVADHDAGLPDRFHDTDHTAESVTCVKNMSSPMKSGVYQPSPWVRDLLDTGRQHRRRATARARGERAHKG